MDAAKVDRLLLNDLAPLLERARAGYVPCPGKRSARFDEDTRVAWALVGERLSRDDVLLPAKFRWVVEKGAAAWLVEEASVHPWCTEDEFAFARDLLFDSALVPIGAEETLAELRVLASDARDQLLDFARRLRWGTVPPDETLDEAAPAAVLLCKAPDVLDAWVARALREDEALCAAGLVPDGDPDEGLVPALEWDLAELSEG